MNKFLKNSGLYVAFIAFCIGMISCSSDNEDDMEGYSIRQLLVGEWELDMGESEKVSDFHKLFFKDDEGVLTLREGEAIAYSYPCWMFDPETNVVSLEIAVPVNPNFAGYILYICKVVSVDSKNLVLRYISESNSRELHYKRVAKYESIAKPENKYKRQDFYGSWEYSYPNVHGNVTYTNKIRYTFLSDSIKMHTSNYVNGDSNIRMDGNCWSYDPVFNLLEIGTMSWQPSTGAGHETVVDSKWIDSRLLFYVDELTDEHIVLRRITDGISWGAQTYTFNRVK